MEKFGEKWEDEFEMEWKMEEKEDDSVLHDLQWLAIVCNGFDVMNCERVHYALIQAVTMLTGYTIWKYGKLFSTAIKVLSAL